MKCSYCGSVGLESGYVSDLGQGARGYAEWIAGPLQFGPLGFPRRRGRARLPVIAYRCPNCAHLEMFAG
jgi:hypothetical protein